MSTQAFGSSASGLWHPVQRRMVVWRPRPVHPFRWGGLLPLLGLLGLLAYAIGPFAEGELEATVRHSVQAKLLARGLADVKAEVTGQWVRLSGALPEGVEEQDVVGAVRKAMCATWLGEQPCALEVTARFNNTPAATASAASAGSARPGPARPAVVPPAALSARATGFTAVSTPVFVPGFMPAGMRRSSVPVPEACERALAAETARSRIEFAVGSATLLPSSDAVLDRVANAAADCKGLISVDGHTDAQGEAQRNEDLSLARAEAVRQALASRGLRADRMRVQGFGALKPMADNGTPEGRRRNRRIEFKLAAAY